MCGRYTIAHSSDEILERFEAIIAEATGTTVSADNAAGDVPPAGLNANFNVAPSHPVPIIYRPGTDPSESEPRLLETAKWGFLPFWAKDAKKNKPMINARSESLMESRMFKHPFMRQRCIIPADSFYEWQKTEGKKIPTRILLKGHGLFGFAGIWDETRDAAGNVVKSCAIITVPANELVSPVHDRMPAILPRELEAAWLDCSRFDPELLKSALAPYPDDLMELYAVSDLVNSVRNNSPACVDPASTLSHLDSLAESESSKPSNRQPGKQLAKVTMGDDSCPTQLKIPFN